MQLERKAEKALVRRIQAARKEKDEAFDELYKQYERTLRGYVRLRVRSDDDVDEIISDTWLKFWSSLSRYNPDQAPLVPFLRLLALHAMSDYFKKRNRIREYEELWADTEKEVRANEGLREFAPDRKAEFGDRKTDPENAAVFLEVVEAILDDDSPPHRLLAYCYWQLLEWKPAEIARIAGDHKATLGWLEALFEDEYSRAVPLLDRDRIAAMCATLRDRLKKTVREVVPDPKEREHLNPLLDRQAGGTRLEEYYRGDATTNISHWCDRVRKRIIEKAAGPRPSGSTFNRR